MQKVYARINVPWGLDGAWSVGDPNVPAGYFVAFSPTADYPEDTYSVQLWGNWTSIDYQSSFNVGQVIELVVSGDPGPIVNPSVIFSRPV